MADLLVNMDVSDLPRAEHFYREALAAVMTGSPDRLPAKPPGRCYPPPAPRSIAMPMPLEELEAALREGFPDAEIRIDDLAGDGDHYRARIVSPAFKGLPRVKQHQLVYAALKGRMGGELHALALETSAPA